MLIDIDKYTDLMKIKLTDKNRANLVKAIKDFQERVEAIASIDVSSVEPLFTTVDDNYLIDDSPCNLNSSKDRAFSYQSSYVESLLTNAVTKMDNFFVVPTFLKSKC